MQGSPTGSDMGQLDVPEPADGWTRARQVFSGALEGVPQLLEGAAIMLARGAAYIAPGVGPAIFLLDVYTQAQKHGGGAAGAFIAMNEMFNPAYAVMGAGIGAYDAHESGDDRKMGNQLFHLGVGVIGAAVLLEGGLKGAAKGGEAPRGAGVTWKTIGERPDPSVVRQKYPNACGPACVTTVLRELGGDLSKLTPVQVMAEAGGRYNPHGGIQPRDMQTLMNEIDPRTDLSWRTDVTAHTSIVDAVREHSANGPWFAGTRAHYVIVRGLDEAGNVIIQDTATGTRYVVTVEEFARHWSRVYVARQ
jgi:predicted double-glycine peptidase